MTDPDQIQREAFQLALTSVRRLRQSFSGIQWGNVPKDQRAVVAAELGELAAELAAVSLQMQPDAEREPYELVRTSLVSALKGKLGDWREPIRDCLADAVQGVEQLRRRAGRDGTVPARGVLVDLAAVWVIIGRDAALLDRCPTCGSPDPERHPAVQHEGEVSICPDRFHARPVP